MIAAFFSRPKRIKTVEPVFRLTLSTITPLKRGVNETNRGGSPGICAFFGLALMILLAGLLAGAAAPPLPASSGAESVNLPLEFKRGHIMIAAQVNGSNSVWLMLDTGFSITMIDPRLAETLKLARIGKTRIVGVAGEEQADVFEGPTFELAGASYTPRRVAALPSDRNRRARRMEGVLGAGFFRRFVVEIDSQARTIKLHEPKDYQYDGPGEILPLKLRDSTPVVEASINIAGRPPIRGLFEIDTGCDGGLCLGHDFVEANNLLDAGYPVQGGSRSGVGGDAETKVGSVPQLQLGGLTVDKPEVNFFLRGSPVDHGHAGHIGIQVLRQFRVIFDYSRQRLILEKRKSG